jgi:hypothetical protein
MRGKADVLVPPSCPGVECVLHRLSQKVGVVAAPGLAAETPYPIARVLLEFDELGIGERVNGCPDLLRRRRVLRWYSP